MSCHATPLTEGLKDLFGILVRRIMPLCEMQWRTQVKLDVPHYFFFTKMLEHAGVTDEYLHSQMELAGLEDDMEFKLVVMDVDGETEPERAAARHTGGYATSTRETWPASPTRTRRWCCATRRRATTGFRTSRRSETCASTSTNHFGIASGVSEVFTGITNLDLAYRQAKIALGLRRTIEQRAIRVRPGRKQG